MKKNVQKAKNNTTRANTFRRENYYLRDAEQEYEAYENENLRRGFIKTQALTARKTLPVEGVKVEIIKQLPSGPYVVDSQMTDLSGLTKEVRLPTVAKMQSLLPGVKEPFETYDLRFTHPNYMDLIIRDVPVYEGITTFQLADMSPAINMPGQKNTIEYGIAAPVI